MLSPSPSSRPQYASARTRRHKSAWAYLRGGVLCLLVLAFAFCSFSGLYFGTDNWRLDLLSHFRWPLFATGILLVCACAAGRHWLLLLAALSLLAFNSALLVHHWRTPPQVARAAANAPTIRALSINVYSRNDDIDRVLSYIDSQSPDIVALIEVTGKWLPALEHLRTEYPHQARQIWGNNFGSVILSRYPLHTPPRSYGYSGVGSIARIAELPQGRCLLLLAHPIAPITERTWEWNASTLRDIEKYVTAARAEQPVLVLGDLNNSPWNHSFRQFQRNASLRPPDSKRIWWPTWRVVSWPAAIPIDHFLLSPGLQDTHTWVGPDVGSDHSPIGLDFALGSF